MTASRHSGSEKSRAGFRPPHRHILHVDPPEQVLEGTILAEMESLRRQLQWMRANIESGVRALQLQDQIIKTFASFIMVVIPILLAYFVDYWCSLYDVTTPQGVVYHMAAPGVRRIRNVFVGGCFLFSCVVAGPCFVMCWRELERLQLDFTSRHDMRTLDTRTRGTTRGTTLDDTARQNMNASGDGSLTSAHCRT